MAEIFSESHNVDKEGSAFRERGFQGISGLRDPFESGYDEVETQTQNSSLVPAISSFLVWGGGQLYNRELRKAAVFFTAELVTALYFWDFFAGQLVFQIVSGWIGVFTYKLILSAYGLFALFIWGFCVYDARETAKFIEFVHYRNLVNSYATPNTRDKKWDAPLQENTQKPWGMVLVYFLIIFFLGRYILNDSRKSEFHVLTERIRQNPESLENRFALVRYYVQNEQIRHAIPELEDYKNKYAHTLDSESRQKLEELLSSLQATEKKPEFITTGVLQSQASRNPEGTKIEKAPATQIISTAPTTRDNHQNTTTAKKSAPDWLKLRQQMEPAEFAAMGDQYLAEQGTEISLVKLLLSDAFRQGDWPRVKELASVGLRTEPHNPSLLESLAIAEEQIRRHSVETTSSPEKPETAAPEVDPAQLLMDAGALFNRNENSAALKVLERYFAAGGKHRDAYHLQYSIHIGNNNFEAAILTLIQALKNEPGDERALENLARIYFRQGDYALASRYFQELTELNPSPANLKNAGIAFKRFGKTDEAVKLYRRGLEADGNDETIIFLLAFVLLEKGETAEAISLYERLFKLNPQYPLLNYYLGQALEAGNFYSEAVSAYSQVKTDSPVYQKARERISALTTAIPQPNLTEKARPATEIQPEQTIKPAQRPQTVQPIQNNQPAQNTQTQPSNRLSQTAPTTQTSPRQQITETTISTVAPLLEAAEKAYRKNDWTLAREYYEKVLAVDPRNVHALTQIGRIYFAFENQYEKAQNYLLQALQLNPDSVWLNLAVGIIEKAFNRPDSALRYFQRALILDPTHLNANFNLALIYEERNQIEKAKDHYMAVIINHPGHQLAYNYLGDIYFNEGDYFKAQDMYREILNTSPANIGIRLKLAICLEKVNDLNGSLREYERLQPLVAGQDFVEQEVSSSIERLKRQIR